MLAWNHVTTDNAVSQTKGYFTVLFILKGKMPSKGKDLLTENENLKRQLEEKTRAFRVDIQKLRYEKAELGKEKTALKRELKNLQKAMEKLEEEKDKEISSIREESKNLVSNIKIHWIN